MFDKLPETDKNIKKKKRKKVLRAILGLIVIWGLVNLSITLIFSGVLPHRFASAEEGRDIMLSNTEYYDNLTQNDLDFRMGKTGATKEEFLDASRESVTDFYFFEKWYLNSRLARMALNLRLKGYDLPEVEEIVFIKADMDIESGASGYTHGTQIYLNGGLVTAYALMDIIPGSSEFMDQLLYHELFHCLTRSNPPFRADMYSLIHFTVTGTEYELPPCVLDRFISNPDVEHHDSYAAFIIDGQQIDCYTVWITTKSYAEAQSGFMSNDATVLVPVDGTDVYYTREQASNFDDVFGTNTGYVTDPEECMADNFAYAMLYGMKGKNGKGYPDPQIIEGIIDYLKR
ncbi:MAG: hypothetical protein J6S47_05340 [Eubacteriaceae bacterium]|nr:hypothetical protein [Eubacteriaceae bacterium]